MFERELGELLSRRRYDRADRRQKGHQRSSRACKFTRTLDAEACCAPNSRSEPRGVSSGVQRICHAISACHKGSPGAVGGLRRFILNGQPYWSERRSERDGATFATGRDGGARRLRLNTSLRARNPRRLTLLIIKGVAVPDRPTTGIPRRRGARSADHRRGSPASRPDGARSRPL